MSFRSFYILMGAVLLCQTPALAETEAAGSFFSKSQKLDSDGAEHYSSNLDMKSHKKIGLGLSLGGSSGFMAVNSELNLDPQEALGIGFGTGPSYGSLNLTWKHNFEAQYLSPFGKLGFSKWFSSSNNPAAAKNSDVLRRVFSEKDLNSGKFDADFLVASAGVEYNQLQGELAGVNFYGELDAMIESKRTSVTPTGSLGVIYFY